LLYKKKKLNKSGLTGKRIILLHLIFTE